MRRRASIPTLALVALLIALAVADAAPEKGAGKERGQEEDPYAEYLWPPPPDEARIKLVDVIRGRVDVETDSRLGRVLFGASPPGPYDLLQKPFAVAFDPEGRILVTDSGAPALIRFDRAGRKMDVLGTRGSIRLKLPLGLDVAADGVAYVADAGLQKVVALDPGGKVKAVYGRQGDLSNPTDAAVSPDGKQLYVADSKAHSVVVFDIATGAVVRSFGEPGDGEGQFAFPTSLAFDPEGNLLIVDQINARVQLVTPEGDFLDSFGAMGVGFGNFVRPKDVAVDERGFIYVTDNAFNNFQVFDVDFTLLTFVGEGGTGPGRFHGASGVAAQGDRLAVVDQLGRRVQVFRSLGGEDP